MWLRQGSVGRGRKLQQQSVGALRGVVCEVERVSMIEIDVVTAAAAAAAAVLSDDVWAGGDSGVDGSSGGTKEKVVVMKEDVVRFGDWMEEWGAMVRWCGGGRWERLL